MLVCCCGALYPSLSLSICLLSGLDFLDKNPTTGRGTYKWTLKLCQKDSDGMSQLRVVVARPCRGSSHVHTLAWLLALTLFVRCLGDGQSNGQETGDPCCANPSSAPGAPKQRGLPPGPACLAWQG